MAFRVGQRVTPIDNFDWEIHGHETVPIFGAIYTIRAIDLETRSGCGFLLQEIRNKPDVYYGRAGIAIAEKRWRASRFRPVVERKTDISVFKAMLNPSLEDVANLIMQEIVL